MLRVNRRKSFWSWALAVALLFAGLSWVTACNSGDGPSASIAGGGDANAVIQARGLTPDDVYAAVKTFMPTGQHDEYVIFASGGHGGNLMVIGVPSMRILKIVGVFTLAFLTFFGVPFVSISPHKGAV